MSACRLTTFANIHVSQHRLVLKFIFFNIITHLTASEV
jgi:hypothetical protein